MHVTTPLHSVDMDQWEEKTSSLKEPYSMASPFPHAVLDNFLDQEAALAAYEAFPKVGDEGWIHYLHVNEKKHGLNKLDRLPAQLRDLIAELNTDRFVKWLEGLTGITGLKADPMLEGGGLHQSSRGGFLNIHADFTVHPHKRNWRRRVNVLVYLNKGWEEDWGGQLELWERDMSKCTQRVTPLFNRCVIFNTDEDSYHGLPDPLTCPEDQSRKSIALYYFTEEETAPKLRTTNYRARPTDGIRSAAIWLDNLAVNIYTRLKRALGINDDVISKILRIFGGKK